MRQKNTQSGSRVVRTLLAAALGTAATAAQAVDAADSWQFEVTPYFLAAAIDATAGVGNVETDIDLSSSDVLENTEGGFMMMTTARHGKWSLGFDASYFKLVDGGSDSVSGPLGRATAKGTVEVTSEQWIYQPMLGYRVLDDKLKLDLYGGARYTKLQTDLDLKITTTIAAFPGGERDFSADKDWTDLVAGGHVSFPLAQNWSLIGLADVGTGQDSDLSYQLLAAANWQISEMFSAKFGYRYIYQDFEEDAFSWEVVYSGIIAGVGIRF